MTLEQLVGLVVDGLKRVDDTVSIANQTYDVSVYSVGTNVIRIDLKNKED